MTNTDADAISFWNELYAERDRVWSGRPNAALVQMVADLPAGHALDLGCGEGGDTVWLTEQGWEVTAVDISSTALDRARAAADARGLHGIHWAQADLAEWEPPAAYDLVSACFLHSPVDFPREAVLRRAAAAVAPGGHLLVVGHAAPPPWSRHQHHDEEGLRPVLPTLAEEIDALALDPERWETLVAETADRQAVGPDGEAAVLQDNVIWARRR